MLKELTHRCSKNYQRANGDITSWQRWWVITILISMSGNTGPMDVNVSCSVIFNFIDCIKLTPTTIKSSLFETLFLIYLHNFPYYSEFHFNTDFCDQNFWKNSSAQKELNFRKSLFINQFTLAIIQVLTWNFLISRASRKFLGLIDSKSQFSAENFARRPPTARELICAKKYNV